MARGADTTYYDLLELERGASFEDIEASYQRMVGFVAPESLAVYSLFGEEEALALRSQIEEAYRTLSDPDRRAAYDRVLAGGSYPAVLIPEQRSDANVSLGLMRPEPRDISLDAPMDVDAIFRDGGGAPDEMASLDAPPVSVRAPEPREVSRAPEPRSEYETRDARPEYETREPRPEVRQAPEKYAEVRPESRVTPTPRPPVAAPTLSAKGQRRRLTPSPDIEINFEVEFSGAILRRLRESCQATLDEVAEITKISKRYLLAIEENDFNGLPASVYVRGFVSEYARVLGLDMQRVAQSYMALYKRYRGEGG